MLIATMRTMTAERVVPAMRAIVQASSLTSSSLDVRRTVRWECARTISSKDVRFSSHEGTTISEPSDGTQVDEAARAEADHRQDEEDDPKRKGRSSF